MLRLNLDESQLNELKRSKEGNYYLTTEFKPAYSKSLATNFGVLLVNKVTGSYFKPGTAILPSHYYKKDQLVTWYKLLFPLNTLIKELKSIKDLSLYDIQVTVKNKSTNNSSSLLLNNVKIIYEDFSGLDHIHNIYINDLIQWFTPAREFYSESLKKGKIPFWSNYTLTGSEFVAEPQVGFFHPLYILTYLIFDHFTAHAIIIFLCLLLCGTGAFLLAQYWRLSFGASLLTSIVYMFHPFNVTWFSFEHMLMNSATLPFLLLAYGKNLEDSRLVNKYLLISALLLSLIFLSGHLQVVYYTVIVFFLFTLFQLFESLLYKKKDFVKHLFSIFFVFLFAIAIGAIVVLPFFPLFENSHRVANPEDFIKVTSIKLKVFIGLIYPYYCGYPYETHSEVDNLNLEYKIGFFRNYVYFGFLPFLISLFSFRFSFQKKLTLFFVLCLSFSLLICTGSPIFFLIKDYIPGFKQLQHYRFLQVYSFCVPFLAGIGFQVLLNYLSFLKQRTVKFIVIMVILVTSIDLMYFSSYFVTWSDRKDYKPLPSGGALEFLVNKQKESKEPFRVLPFSVYKIGETKLNVNIAQPNTLQPYKLEDVSGYSSLISKDIYSLFVYIQTHDPSKLYPKEVIQLFSNTNIPYPIYNFRSKILDLLNVKYFLVPNLITLESENTKRVFNGDCAIYENTDYLPRAFVVPSFIIIHSPKKTIAELESRWFNPYEQVILKCFPKEYERAIKQVNQNTPPLNYKVDFKEYDHNKMILQVMVNKPAIFVLGHNLNSNWRVRINHKNTTHFQANLVQRAVFLPEAGEYIIEFYYCPKLFLIGFLIASIAVLILIFLAIYLKLSQSRQIKELKINNQLNLEK